MHIKTRNVNHALYELVDRFDMPGWAKKTDSRNGPVLMIDEPLTVTYERPQERVLFNPVRDANPFFHLYESLWMLAGRDDVDAVAYYAKQMREFSDDGRRLNGAYGRRWRATQGVPQLTKTGYFRPGVDQLNVLVAHLKSQPNSRRAVLRMWNVEDDLLKIGGECLCGADRTGPSAEAHDETCPAKYPPSKDVCCNLDVLFSIREVESDGAIPPHPDWKIKERFLDMTVVNRSNDLLWGMLGANYVHFSFLQEYLACRLGVSIGRYHHVTNNCHVYTARKDWKPEELLEANDPAWYNDNEVRVRLTNAQGSSITVPVKACAIPLVKDPARFDAEVQVLVEAFSGPNSLAEMKGSVYDQVTEPFLRDVAYPMLLCHHWHKRIKQGAEDEGDREDALSNVAADDWRIAGQQWLARRMKK